MVKFIRFIFTLIIAAAIIGLAVIVVGNYSGKLKQDEKLEEERNRIAKRYSVETQERVLPAVHIAVESQEMSGSKKVLRTTILVKQYSFNKWKPIDPSGKDEYERRDSLPPQRLVIQGSVLQVNGLYVQFNEAIPDYEFLGGKSVWCLTEIFLNPEGIGAADATSTIKLFPPGEVPDIFGEEGKDPSLMESNLWHFIGEMSEGIRTGDKEVMDRLSKFDVRRLGPKQIRLNQSTAYRIDISAGDIKIAPELQSSLHQRILDEAEKADKRVRIPRELP